MMTKANGMYKNPERLTRDLNEQRLADKYVMNEEREKLSQKVSYDLPRASKQAVDAIVFKTLQEKKHIAEMEPIDPELTLKPDISKTLRN